MAYLKSENERMQKVLSDLMNRLNKLEDQTEMAYKKSEDEKMQKVLSDLISRLSELEDLLAEKDKVVKKLEDEVRCRRALLADQQLPI